MQFSRYSTIDGKANAFTDVRRRNRLRQSHRHDCRRGIHRQNRHRRSHRGAHRRDGCRRWDGRRVWVHWDAADEVHCHP